MSWDSTSPSQMSRGTRIAITAGVSITCSIVLSLIAFFIWRTRHVRYTKELGEAHARSGITSWPTSWPTRSRLVAPVHAEPEEIAPPAYELAQPLPVYEPPKPDRDGLESYEMATLSHGRGNGHQDV